MREGLDKAPLCDAGALAASKGRGKGQVWLYGCGGTEGNRWETGGSEGTGWGLGQRNGGFHCDSHSCAQRRTPGPTHVFPCSASPGSVLPDAALQEAEGSRGRLGGPALNREEWGGEGRGRRAEAEFKPGTRRGNGRPMAVK